MILKKKSYTLYNSDIIRHSIKMYGTSLDLSKWVAIRFCRNFRGEMYGANIIIGKKVYFIPGLTRKEFITKCLFDFENKSELYMDYLQRDTTFDYCHECNGTGILDIVSAVVKSQTNRYNRGTGERNNHLTKILVYNRPKHNVARPTKNNIFLSTVVFNPELTERHCDRCLGTGVVLSATHGFFLDAREIRKYLTEIDLIDEDAIKRIYDITEPDTYETDFNIE